MSFTTPRLSNSLRFRVQQNRTIGVWLSRCDVRVSLLFRPIIVVLYEIQVWVGISCASLGLTNVQIRFSFLMSPKNSVVTLMWVLKPVKPLKSWKLWMPDVDEKCAVFVKPLVERAHLSIPSQRVLKLLISMKIQSNVERSSQFFYTLAIGASRTQGDKGGVKMPTCLYFCWYFATHFSLAMAGLPDDITIPSTAFAEYPML